MAYVFDPEVLHEIARDASGRPPEEMFTTIIEELDRRHPGRICRSPGWVFNTACGATGQLALLYGSLSEYVILFGTPIGTEGHSGRYMAEVYDFMLSGEMQTYHEGEFEPQVFRAGDAALLTRGRSKGYKAEGGTWMLEYARGRIPTMLPTGLADNFSSNLDFRSVGVLLRDYARLCVPEMLRGLRGA